MFEGSETTTSANKAGTNRWKRSMASLRFCWFVLALWYMCQGTTHQQVSAQINGRKFEIVQGVRYQSGEQTTLTASSMVECAIICVNDKECSNFNSASGQCELLPAGYSSRNNAAGWTHGYYPTGKGLTTFRIMDLAYGRE